jgi:hypothetical protein
MPTRITQLDASKGTRPVRSPGFKVEKHNDGKSVRLFHITDVCPGEAMEHHSRLFPGCAQMRRLVSYNTALEQEGFFHIAINNRDPLAPYSLWRRVDGSSRA